MAQYDTYGNEEYDKASQVSMASNRHALRQWEINSMAQYQCPACGKSFDSPSELRTHAKTCRP
jgi:Zinc finger, C2H2 type